MENTNDLQHKIDYFNERTIAEGRVPQHMKQEYGDKLDVNKFVPTSPNPARIERIYI